MKKLYYQIEAFLTRLLNIKRSVEPIPQGEYCYEILGRSKDGIVSIRTCPYYKEFKDGDTACRFVGSVGWDELHSDRCKICGEKNLGYDPDC